MISRKTIAWMIGVFCLLGAGTASAQPRWGRERVPEAGACFYENIDYGGRYFCVRPGDALSSLPSGMNDKISSMRLFGAAEVTLFRDRNMRGRSVRFASDVPDFRRQGWNDQVSSIEVGRGDRGRDRDRGRGWRGDRPPEWGREALPREGACFYRDADFRGDYFCVPRGAEYSSLPRGFNDSISSIRLIGARVRIFQDRDFRGRSTDVRRDVTNLRGSWRDTVSSIRVF